MLDVRYGQIEARAASTTVVSPLRIETQWVAPLGRPPLDVLRQPLPFPFRCLCHSSYLMPAGVAELLRSLRRSHSPDDDLS